MLSPQFLDNKSNRKFKIIIRMPYCVSRLEYLARFFLFSLFQHIAESGRFHILAIALVNGP